MKVRILLTVISNILLLQNIAMSQSDEILPFKEIPNYPNTYTAGTAIARLVDGLGYRFYWATEGLTTADLEFKPSEDARTSGETIEHITRMSISILGTSRGEANAIPDNISELSFEEHRSLALNNFQKASDLLKELNEKDLESRKVFFGSNSSDFPYWNLINGMISDSIYHTGQIVSFRRSSGNPINPGVNVFLGKTRDQ